MAANRNRVRLAVSIALLVVGAAIPAHAVHWYRGPGGGCTPADGELTDDPAGTTPSVIKGVVLGHNVFGAGAGRSGFSAEPFVAPTETRIKAGESIHWTWNSAHCHSVTSTDFVSGSTTRVFDSGFHYPTTPPESPRVVPGFFEYPALDDTPTLAFTHTFATPGTYTYFCVHHVSIGMRGVVIVEA